MTKKQNILLGIVIASMTVLTMQSAAADRVGKETAQPGYDNAEQRARGGKAWTQHCKRCHNLRAPNEKQDYEWDISVNHMRIIGNIPGETTEDIKMFLKAAN